MRFKNLSIYQLPFTNPMRGLDAPQASQLLFERLLIAQFFPCLETEPESAGFVPPFGAADYDIVRLIGLDAVGLCLQTEKRLVSAAALREEVEEECRAIADTEGKPPGKNRRKDIKERLLLRNLRKAQTVKRRLFAVFDAKLGLLYVDTANGGQADALLKWLRVVLQTFPVLPLRFNKEPQGVMTGWLRADDEGGLSLPFGLELGDELALEEPGEPFAQVRLKQIPDNHPTLQTYLADGFQATSARLLWGVANDDGMVGHRLAFTLDTAARVKSITMNWHSPEHEAATDAEAEFDADALLWVGEVRDLLAEMAGWFGGLVDIDSDPDAKPKPG